jgi:hypothetical protein
MTVEAYLYDVARGELIFGKKYQAPAEKTKAGRPRDSIRHHACPDQ